MRVNDNGRQLYDEYRDSGVMWLGIVPAHWSIVRLKSTVMSFSNGIWGEDANNDGSDIACIRVSDFDRTRLSVKSREFTVRSVPEQHRKQHLLTKGDLLIEKSGGGENQPVGFVVSFDVDLPAVCSNFIARIRVSVNNYSRFLAYLHACLYSSGITRYSIKQTTGIQNLDIDQYFEEKVAIPSFSEQQAIADFLDRETAKIDVLIAKNRSLLELLAERRQGIITQTVTKGLDPNAPMKDIGVEWLGDIPKSWNLTRLKHVAEVRSGVAKGRSINRHEAVSVPYLRVANVQDGYVDLSDVAEIEVLPHEIPVFSLREGDVLMNEGGDSDKLGRGAIWDGAIDPCLHQNHVFAVRCFDIEPKYLSFITSSDYAKAYFESRSKQTTNLASISATNLKELPIILPSPDEQIEIAAYLDQQIAKIDGFRDKIMAIIERLQERRIALISEVVTGKIKVVE